MFPEDFPTMLAAADILKEAGCDVCGRFPLLFMSRALAVKSCHFSPGCVEPVSPACRAL